ncbi:hypothetical protein [Microvirga roseola]|uniref:hypothetical protein n=1 Tax=Microvirga roseola TaxID=2883126 RepID=UPI001E572097|nr:hypothetical protein [Microvirga roseola]
MRMMPIPGRCILPRSTPCSSAPNTILAGETPLPKSRSHLVYDPEIDETESEDLWLDVVKRTAPWPAAGSA